MLQKYISFFPECTLFKKHLHKSKIRFERVVLRVCKCINIFVFVCVWRKKTHTIEEDRIMCIVDT